MLELQLFGQKNSFIKTNGDTVIDLTRRGISFKGVTVNQGRTYIVENGIEMRPDLISKVCYQTNSLLCMLMKYNGISNPFSINEGDILKIPNGEVLSSLKSEPALINGSNDNWITSTRKKNKKAISKIKTLQDSNRVEYLQKLNEKPSLTPPNIAKDTSVKVVNGKIIFGTDVTSVRKQDCPDPISRTKLQAQLIKNKISK